MLAAPKMGQIGPVCECKNLACTLDPLEESQAPLNLPHLGAAGALQASSSVAAARMSSLPAE